MPSRKRRVGRPPKAPKDRKSVHFHIKATKAEGDRIRELAGGKGVSAYLREKALS